MKLEIKRAAALLTAVFLLFTLLPVAVFAADGMFELVSAGKVDGLHAEAWPASTIANGVPAVTVGDDDHYEVYFIGAGSQSIQLKFDGTGVGAGTKVSYSSSRNGSKEITLGDDGVGTITTASFDTTNFTDMYTFTLDEESVEVLFIYDLGVVVTAGSGGSADFQVAGDGLVEVAAGGRRSWVIDFTDNFTVTPNPDAGKVVDKVTLTKSGETAEEQTGIGGVYTFTDLTSTIYNIGVTFKDHPDVDAVAAAKTAIGTAIELPFAVYADNSKIAEAATAAAQKLIAADSGVTVTVTYVTDHFEAALKKNDATDTVNPYNVTIAPDPDIAAVTAAKTAIGTGIGIPDGTYADETAKAVAATAEVKKLIPAGNGTSVEVKAVTDGFEAVLTKGAVTQTVTDYKVTVITNPVQLAVVGAAEITNEGEPNDGNYTVALQSDGSIMVTGTVPTESFESYMSATESQGEGQWIAVLATLNHTLKGLDYGGGSGNYGTLSDENAAEAALDAKNNGAKDDNTALLWLKLDKEIIANGGTAKRYFRETGNAANVVEIVVNFTAFKPTLVGSEDEDSTVNIADGVLTGIKASNDKETPAMTAQTLTDQFTNLPDGYTVTVKSPAGNVITGTAAVGTGMTVELIDGDDEIVETVVVVVPGDVLGSDGLVDATDLLQLAHAVTKTVTLDAPFAKAAELDGNASLDAVDLLTLANMITAPVVA